MVQASPKTVNIYHLAVQMYRDDCLRPRSHRGLSSLKGDEQGLRFDINKDRACSQYLDDVGRRYKCHSGHDDLVARPDGKGHQGGQVPIRPTVRQPGVGRAEKICELRLDRFPDATRSQKRARQNLGDLFGIRWPELVSVKWYLHVLWSPMERFRAGGVSEFISLSKLISGGN